MGDHRSVQLQPGVVDHVEVGLVAVCDLTAIVKSDKVGGRGRELFDGLGDTDSTGRPVARPVGEQECRIACVADHSAMGAAVTKSAKLDRSSCILENIHHVVDAKPLQHSP